MSTLFEIEEATKALPFEEKEILLTWLSRHLKQMERTPRNSVLDIETVSLGEIFRPFEEEDDVLGEMLEDRL